MRQTKEWTFGYVWKDETGEIHIVETTVESHYGCVTLHIPAGHLEGLVAGGVAHGKPPS